jgi:hypothetical protein
MKNFIIITLVYFVTTLSNADTLEYANADEYSITIESVKLCQNATIVSEESFSVSGCVTLGNSSLTVDIASADISGTLGKYADTNTLQAGTTYRYFVPTINRNFSIRGSAVLDSQVSGTFTCNTDENASRASNAINITQIAGNVNGTATTTTTFSTSTTSSGIVCLNTACDNSQTGLSFDNNIPDNSTLYGNAINVPSDTSDTMEMLYTISTPFTMSDIPPVINMSFGTKSAIQMESTRDAGSDSCRVAAYFPKFRVTVSLPN